MSEALRPKMKTATLVDKQLHAGGRLAVIKLRPDDGPRWWYQAGQYTTLALDTPHGFIARAYSIAGSPLDDGLEFYIALVENGKLTPTLFAQEPGAKFHFLKNVGKFTLKQAAKRTIVMVSTGTGLAPFVGMIRTLWKSHHAGVPTSHRVVLFQGASYADELCYRQELETYSAAKAQGFDLTCVFTASRPDPARGWTPATATGRVNEVVRHVIGAEIPAGRSVVLPVGVDVAALRALIAPADTAFMTCGNPGMIKDLEEPVKHLGVTTSLCEEFW